MIPAITNHLWQSTIVAAVAGLLTLLLRKNGANVRHALWLTASLKFLIPFALLVSIGSHWSWRTAGPPSPAAATIQQISQPFTAAAAPAPFAATVREAPSSLPMVLFVVWACGFVAVVISWTRRWARMRADVRAASPLDIQLPIPVRSCATLREPGVFGLLRPVLLLPAGLVDRLTPDQLQTILAHELCHVRRRDNLWSAIHMAVGAIFWFHPLVWWIGSRLVEERERACDEEVLRQGGDPQVYAEGILNVCRLYVESPLVCVAGVTGANLKRRIEDIMTGCTARKLNFVRKALLAAAAMGAVAGPLAIGFLNAPRIFGQTNAAQYTNGLTTVAEKKFDVASVKPGPPGDDGWHINPPQHATLDIGNLELRRIISNAFRIQPSTVIGPDWLDSARYDILAKGSDPTVGYPVVWEMLRSLLAERFQLKYHVEQRERPIYALVIAKSGHKLTRPEDGVCKDAILRNEHCANQRFGPDHVGITNMPIGALAATLGRLIGERPVVDKTGLTGFYDVDVAWGSEGPANENAPPQMDVGAMMAALEKQAGLKLEAQRGPVDFLVIDRVERPSPN
jgi:bla regulator protein BlaR1